MSYYKDTENKLHWLDSAEFIHLLPQGSVKITKEEADELCKPPTLTQEEQFEAVRVALQSAIDAKARDLGFKSGGNALMLYAGKDNPYRSIADVFFLWESSVWAEADAYKEEVIAGTKPMLSPSEAVALMPEYPA